MRFAVSMLSKHRRLFAAVLCNAVGASLLWTCMSRFDTGDEYWSVRGREIAGSVIGAIGILFTMPAHTCDWADA